ncbi:MAG: 30S ribosomal protein S4 [Chlorobi bacterium]|nr:MAG: 30S ribosomal protein S4 [Bacteroidota bacterium]KXK35997.1 MAG: 30S ribosomal protein S4 [Chlorobi bacterium OLB6]MBE2266299.1 30S ribosomal protein S4 [Flavobacteriales bacterium]MBL1161393.1 30S ribosomal protein S4 [Chlorobiota bacterium]MBW7854050.1 30S ribosomal protein S4 [Candidatus Kapabacteria bacterium]MCC6331129.1 30S ribosomal protein S4 [Ignavibacteria bacterium]
MKYNGPKTKLSRKVGFAIAPKARKTMDRKPGTPGQHGNARRRPKQSDYAKQLLEKQRLRLQYNIHERQLTNTMARANRVKGNKVDVLVQFLEQRLDAIVFRAGLARSIYAARQYVRHGHINVNGKRVNMPAYAVQPNDVITVKEKSRKLEAFQEAIRSSAPPPYLDVSKADFSAKFLYLPPREEVPVVCEVPLVIEYYSR